MFEIAYFALQVLVLQSHNDAACRKLEIGRNSDKLGQVYKYAYKGQHYADMRDVLSDFVSTACCCRFRRLRRAKLRVL